MNLKEKCYGKCVGLLSQHTMSIAALSTWINRLSGTWVLRPLETSSLINHPFYLGFLYTQLPLPWVSTVQKISQYNTQLPLSWISTM